ncbi:MAG: hypothetical protein AB1478_02695 [Nitrospirota bacterium]
MSLKPMSITATDFDELVSQVNYVLDKMWSYLDNITGITENITQITQLTAGDSYHQEVLNGFPAADVTVAKIADAIVNASKINSDMIWIMGVNWQSNMPVAGSIAWNTHTLYRGGVAYSINSGSSGTANKYVYWKVGDNSYSVSNDYNVVKGHFIIAVNTNGTYYEVWNNPAAPEWIDTPMITNIAVTTDKIADAAISSAKIANLAVGTAAIADLAVTSAKIADLAVITAKIADLAVASGKIANLAVTNAKINDLSASKINAGEINITWTGGNIRSGQTAFNSGTGFWIGNDAGTPKFSIGVADGNRFLWDGSALDMYGAVGGNTQIRGTNVIASTHTTKGTHLTSSLAGGETTINVKDTSDFPASGSGWIIDTTNDRDEFSYTGKTATTLTGVSEVLAHNNGAIVIPKTKAILINDSQNEMRFYGDRGDGTIEELTNIGIKAVNSDNIIGSFGSPDSQRIAILGRSSNKTVIYASTGTAIGVHGLSASGYGVKAETTSSGKAPLVLGPLYGTGAPTHIADGGSLWVDASGILYINVDGTGTGWQKVGAQ